MKRQLLSARAVFYLMIVMYVLNLVVRRWVADWQAPQGGWFAYIVQVTLAALIAAIAGYAGRDILNLKLRRKIDRE